MSTDSWRSVWRLCLWPLKATWEILTRHATAAAVLFVGLLGLWKYEDNLADRVFAKDSHLHYSTVPNATGTTFFFTHIAGELTCRIRLEFEERPGGSATFRGRLNGKALDWAPSDDYDRDLKQYLNIVVSGPGDSEFTWRVGDTLVLASTRPLSLRWWRLLAHGREECDDSDQVRFRRVSRWFLGVLVVTSAVALVGAFITTARSGRPIGSGGAGPPLPGGSPLAGAPWLPDAPLLKKESYDRLLTEVIGEIQGEDAAETDLMQGLLRQVLLGGPAPQVVLETPPSKRWPVYLKAKRLLDSRLRAWISALAAVQSGASAT
ncbi:MAG TPA: hypothetical protein VHQ90_02060 [Thermoanaerobaculia bacterium]|nr:hypothetical protein [Thermoanaerobaculia bacterium]